ncbi:sensor histidine kinase [Actinomadura scrupuli]|uniref:sensor histidine kinase n=1 Tax=Actinomadura scrupuli TaxID=559629 RepID=UPI003D9675DE
MTDHAWQRPGLLWDVYFGMVLAATLIIVQLQDHATGTERLTATVLLAAMAPWYVFVGRPMVGRPDDSRRGTLYVLGLLPLLGFAQANVPAGSFVLFGLPAQCFMLLSVRRAMLAMLGLYLVPAFLVIGDRYHGHPKSIAVAALLVLVGFTFATAFGAWIDRIIRQSSERAVLIEQLEATRAELAEAHRLQGTLAERQRLAGEIHDTLAQGFTSILMLLQAADPHVTEEPARRSLELAGRTARENLAEARALIAALSPAALGSAPLADALRRLSGQLGEEMDVAVTYETGGVPRVLPAGIEVVLLRAAQEALANIRKHAGATSASVRLEYGSAAVRLEVCDDGVGFEPRSPHNGHFGLRNIRDRVTQAGGRATIDTAPGQGTVLTLDLPTTPATPPALSTPSTPPP